MCQRARDECNLIAISQHSRRQLMANKYLQLQRKIVLRVGFLLVYTRSVDMFPIDPKSPNIVNNKLMCQDTCVEHYHVRKADRNLRF